jgi:hypothetical protein
LQQYLPIGDIASLACYEGGRPLGGSFASNESPELLPADCVFGAAVALVVGCNLYFGQRIKRERVAMQWQRFIASRLILLSVVFRLRHRERYASEAESALFASFRV